MLLTWADSQQPLAYACLRTACPCAPCRAVRLQGRIDLVQVDVRLLQGYGVQRVLDGGHQQGPISGRIGGNWADRLGILARSV